MSTEQSTRNATTIEAVQLARALLREHGLNDWRVQLDRAKNRFGQCKHTPKIISLSEHLVRLNPLERVRETILHEIAHALVGPGKGHGPEWRAQARKLGIKGERCFSVATTATPEAPYLFVCDTCGTKVQRHRRPSKPRACAKCCNSHAGGVFDVRFLMRIERKR